MTHDTVLVLKERMRRLEADLLEIKGEVRSQGNEIDVLDNDKNIILYRLEQIQRQLDSISATLSKDTGWRGFFIDFLKAAAQIAALVGAGKFIF
ncbi:MULTISPECIES: hypothetical protein [Priestia]|uniref:hypothetical protein n=1 Tax=Priestia TaxID=2800373 RepID=UPI002E1A7238|nr:hypothetical protein [Priestia megaterium]MED4102187.1 hypothetical protein [Priestia megaterium]MED4142614.1 hypothetical protein [Priestia megaterium]